MIGRSVAAAGGFYLHAPGPKAGVRHVREMSKEGPLIRGGMKAANVADLIPNNPNASADWNAGFKEELERMYPETKEHSPGRHRQGQSPGAGMTG